MQITRLSYFGGENQGLPLRSWFVTCWLWRHIPIVASQAVPSSCVVTQTPMETNSGTRRRKRKFPLLFVNCDRGRIEIDHLYGLRCRGWYCNPEQHSLCRPARPQAAARRPAQLVLFQPLQRSTNHSSADRIVVNSYNNAFSFCDIHYKKLWIFKMDCLTAPSHYLPCWQWGTMIFTWDQFHRRYFNQQSLTLVLKLLI